MHELNNFTLITLPMVFRKRENVRNVYASPQTLAKNCQSHKKRVDKTKEIWFLGENLCRVIFFAFIFVFVNACCLAR